MKKNIKPTGLKGKQINERQIKLMGITPINEGVSSYVIELTKEGPDGKAYAIVRENQNYFIKKADSIEGLVVEDFNYIGGLQNKFSNSYSSYSKATKALNLKFLSIKESLGATGFQFSLMDDGLLKETLFYF